MKTKDQPKEELSLKKPRLCMFVWCIDPKTGAVKISTTGKCPKDHIRKLNNAVRSRGIILPEEAD